MNSDDGFDAMLEAAMRQAGEPPATPREALWARIEAERGQRRVAVLQQRRMRRLLVFGGAAAAVLVIGVGIGRFMAPAGRPERTHLTATQQQHHETNPAYRLAAVEHFTRFEVLLTQFQTEGNGAEPTAAVEASAQQLLQDTRLLLDSPAAADADVRGLLEDLETVLVQMVQAGSKHGTQERQWVAAGVNQQGVIDRLRLVAPISPAAAGNRGVY